MKIFNSFLEIAKKYKVVFFDAYGVLKSSTGVQEGIFQVFQSLKEAGIEYYVVTNDASKSPEQMAKAYTHPEMGVMVPMERNISSGLLASDFLRAKVKEGEVAYMGKPDSAYYVKIAGLKPLPVSTITDEHSFEALLMLDDEGYDWFEDINKTVNLLRRHNVPVIVANPDETYPVNRHEVNIAVGSLANMVEQIVGKSFIRFGKPDTEIFTFAFSRAQQVIPRLDKSEVLMVGDTLHTDIIGANKFGIDSMLVLSGNTLKSHLKAHIEATGIIPTYVCESIFS